MKKVFEIIRNWKEKNIIIVLIVMSLAAGSAAVISGPQGWYNVRDYGMKNDSSADITAKLQALCNLVPAGSTIYFPPGHYRKDNTVTVNTSIRFLGTNKTSDAIGYTCAIYEGNSTDSAFVVNSYSTDFEGMNLVYKGGGTPNAASRGIFYNHIDFANVRLTSVTGFNINVESLNGGEYTFDQFSSSEPVTAGLKLQNVANPDNGDGIITRSFFYNSLANTTSSVSIWYVSGGGLRVTDSKFNSIGANHSVNCIYAPFLGTVDFFVDHNSFENSSGPSVYIPTPNGLPIITISSNEFLSAATAGTLLKIDGTNTPHATYSVSIDGNDFVASNGTVDTAIWLKGVEYCTVGAANTYRNFRGTNTIKVYWPDLNTANVENYIASAETLTGPTSGTLKQTIDPQYGNIWTFGLSSNDTIFIKNPIYGKRITMVITQDATGGRVPVLASGGTNAFQGNITNVYLNPVANAISVVEGYVNSAGQLTVTNITPQWVTVGSNMTFNYPSATVTIGSGTAGNSQLNLNGVNGTSPTSITYSLTNVAKGIIGVAATSGGLINGSAAGDYCIRTTGGAVLISTDNGTTNNLGISSAGVVNIPKGTYQSVANNLVNVSGTGTYSALGTDHTIQFTGSTATLAYPTVNLVNGRHLNLVNNGSGTVTIPTTKTGNITTTTTLLTSTRMQVEYDLANTAWIQVN